MSFYPSFISSKCRLFPVTRYKQVLGKIDECEKENSLILADYVQKRIDRIAAGEGVGPIREFLSEIVAAVELSSTTKTRIWDISTILFNGFCSSV